MKNSSSSDQLNHIVSCDSNCECDAPNNVEFIIWLPSENQGTYGQMLNSYG